MHKIAHRINTYSQLKKIPVEYGIEVDVRYHNNDLILHHDPYSHHLETPCTLETLLKHWCHNGPLILNIKTEGIELRCIELMVQYKINNWFFLDLSMPYFVQYSLKAQNNSIAGFTSDNLAVRYSEFEPIEYALSFKNKAHWVWIDCFTKLPLTFPIIKQLKDAHFKLCLVSPELQKHPLHFIDTFKTQLADSIKYIDAVCTKYPEKW